MGIVTQIDNLLVGERQRAEKAEGDLKMMEVIKVAQWEELKKEAARVKELEEGITEIIDDPLLAFHLQKRLRKLIGKEGE